MTEEEFTYYQKAYVDVEIKFQQYLKIQAMAVELELAKNRMRRMEKLLDWYFPAWRSDLELSSEGG